MAITHRSIEIYFGPDDLGAPDDLESTIVGFINGSRVSLDIAVQELEARSIAEAIVAATQRGVTVRMVLEQDYLRSKDPSPSPFDPNPNAALFENRVLFAALLRAGIDVRADYNPKIFHQKFIVRDLEAPTRALLTGSTNFTPTGVGSHPTRKNLNHLVIIHGKRVASEYHKEFEEIWDGTFGSKQKRHGDQPRNNRVSGVKIRALFAPDHTPELEIMKQILKAGSRIDFAIFTFSQSSGIDDAIGARSNANLPVRGIFDSGQGNQSWASSRILAADGVEVFLARRGNHLGKLHHKLMVIDDNLIIAGSFNYTRPANRLNDENIVLIGDLDETNASSRTAQQTLATAAREEIDRIIAANGVPL